MRFLGDESFQLLGVGDDPFVSRLEQKGFVEGFGDAGDRRVKLLRITPAGEECCQNVERHMDEAEAALLMVLIYSLEDTFFIGQTHSDILVAAVSLATPVFLIFMAVAGIGVAMKVTMMTGMVCIGFGQGIQPLLATASERSCGRGSGRRCGFRQSVPRVSAP